MLRTRIPLRQRICPGLVSVFVRTAKERCRAKQLNTRVNNDSVSSGSVGGMGMFGCPFSGGVSEVISS